MTDPKKYKSFLKSYLSSHGITPNHEGKISCLLSDNHAHGNRRQSASVHDDHIYCHGCDKSYDIYDCVRIIEGVSTFNEQISIIKKAAGDYSEPVRTNTIKQVTIKPVALDEDSFLIKVGSEFMSRERLGMLKVPLNYKEVKHWLYRKPDGKVYFAVVRYEDDQKNKTYRNFWCDGKYVRNRMPDGIDHPVYNIEKYSPGNNIILVAGEKCADALQNIVPENYTVLTFLGGEKKAKLVDWSFLSHSEYVFIWPDNDSAGERFGTDLLKLIQGSHLIRIPQNKPQKWDAYDAIHKDGMSWPEIDNLTGNNLSVVQPEPDQPDNNINGLHEITGSYAPKILGFDDFRQINIITGWGGLSTFDPAKLTKNKMLTLAPLHWWKQNFISGEKIADADVQDAIDYIMQIGEQKDFEPDMFRGRGAWMEKTGQIAYNDGREIYGEKYKPAIYLKKRREDIGINDKPADDEVINKIIGVTGDLPFESSADGIRALSWSLLAPFCGALPFRPPMFLTGQSSGGKTTILKMIIRELSGALYRSGGSTVAGLSQDIGMDSKPVILDESEGDTEKQQLNKAQLFTLIRESTSDDAPIESKGSTSGKSVHYQRRSMFFLAGISPEMSQEADFTRFMYVTLGEMKRHDWNKFKKEILGAFSETACKRLRALMWERLDSVLDFTESIADKLELEYRRGSRWSLMNGLIIATWIMIYLNDANPSEFVINDVIKTYMKDAAESEKISDSENFLEKIMTHQIMVDDGSFRRTLTIREIAKAVKDGELFGDDIDGVERIFLNGSVKRIYNATLKRHGIAVNREGHLCIANNSNAIMKITKHNAGYSRRLWRIDGVTHKDKTVSMEGGKPRRSTIFEIWE